MESKNARQKKQFEWVQIPDYTMYIYRNQVILYYYYNYLYLVDVEKSKKSNKRGWIGAEKNCHND